jgi:hypothetical protein
VCPGRALGCAAAACARALRPFCAVCDSSCNLLDAGLSNSWVYTCVYEVSRTFGGPAGYSYTCASGPARVSHKDALLHICTAALPMQGARGPSRRRGGRGAGHPWSIQSARRTVGPRADPPGADCKGRVVALERASHQSLASSSSLSAGLHIDATRGLDVGEVGGPVEQSAAARLAH